MTNNIQMFQYSGSEYNQLNPNLSNLSNNSNQLGGVDSSQYATKEYVKNDFGSKMIKTEVLEDFTYNYTLSNYKGGPKILENKNLFKTLWLIETATISGTIKATYTKEKRVAFGLQLYNQRSFEISVSNYRTETFNNNIYKRVYMVSECNSGSIIASGQESKQLAQFGYHDKNQYGVFIDTNGDYMSYGFQFFTPSSTEYIEFNLNIHYTLERYYFE